MIIDSRGLERAQRAKGRAMQAWNELLGACGDDGRKFGYRLRQLLDALHSTGKLDAKLQAEAIRMHVVELNKKGKSALKPWE